MHLDNIYEAALSNIPDFVYVIGIDRRFIYANKALLEMWGRTAESAFGRTLLELGYEKWHAEMHEREIETVIRTKKPIQGKVPFTGTSGRRIYDYIFSPVFDAGGEVIAIAGATRDVTDRKEMESQLQKSEERSRIALDASEFVGIWSWDLGTMLVTSDERFARLYSVDPVKAQTGVPIAEFFKNIHPEDLKRIAPRIEVILTQGGEFVEEYRISGPDGKEHWVVARGRCQLDDSGKPIRFTGAVVDITERKKAEEKSEYHRRIYETALDNTADFNYVFNCEGRFTYVNRGLAEVLAKSPDDIIGKNFHELGYPAELAQRLQSEIRHVVMTKETVKNETPFTGVYGTRAYEYIFRPVIGQSGHVEAVAGSTRDITEFKEANLRKDEFLAMLSHELRNPIAPISNAINVIQSPAATETMRKEAAELINRQLKQINSLLNDLLDVSRVTLGKIELRCERILLTDVINLAVQSAEPLIKLKNQKLSVTLPASPVHLHADPTRLSQIFSNLLNNATKYTQDHGRIELAAEVEKSVLTVKITDNGIGLAKEAQSRIFDLFVQADSSLERSQGGLGIGLTLVKTLVEMHGGNVTMFSEGEGAGSVFTVKLPLTLPAAGTKPADLVTGNPKAGSAAIYRVLVVDDNEASAKTLGWTLEIFGHEVQLVHDGATAIEMAKEQIPHVILLDIGLPGMNGYDVCKALREIPALSDTVIIAQTGWGQKEHVERSRLAGFDHHLVKPIRLETLKEIMDNIKINRAA